MLELVRPIFLKTYMFYDWGNLKIYSFEKAIFKIWILKIYKFEENLSFANLVL